MTYATIFDAGSVPYSYWTACGITLPLAGVGLLLVTKPALMQKLMPHGLQGLARRIFSWFFFLFSTSMAIFVFASSYSAHQNAVLALQHGNYKIVEGRVANFVPMPFEGHKEESFTVRGIRFTYSDYISSAGFHQPASHGGPIREGLPVRITYNGNLILRLEVAN